MPAPSVRRSAPLNALTAARLTVSTLATLTPRFGSRLFHLDAEGTPAIAMGRMMGIRNAVLAAGLLRLDGLTAPRAFVGINVLVDLVDLAAIIAAGRRGEIRKSGAVLAGATALAAAGLGAAGLAAMEPAPSA